MEKERRYEQVELDISLVMPGSLLNVWIWNSEQRSQLTTKVGHQQASSDEKGRELNWKHQHLAVSKEKSTGVCERELGGVWCDGI